MENWASEVITFFDGTRPVRREIDRSPVSLRRLLRTHLGPYRRLLTIVIVLQAIQTTAALTLPSLNANIIDKGVLQGDDAYIWRTGGIMLFFSFVQIAKTI